MAQIRQAVRGISDACKALSYPVVSGNVSLYNETNNQAIQPTPNIGGIGLIEDISFIPNAHFSEPNKDILLIGNTKNQLGRSLFLREVLGREDGNMPIVDLAAEKQNGEFINLLIKQQLLVDCNDVADGGLLTTIAKMCLIGDIGVQIDKNNIEYLFAEDQARYVISTDNAAQIIELAWQHNINVEKIGQTQKDYISVANEQITLAELNAVFANNIKEYFN